MTSKHRKHPTPETRAEIARAYASGEATAALAARFGISEQTVLRYCHRAGVPTRGRGLPTSPKTIAACREVRHLGVTQVDAAHRWGVSQSTISRALKRAAA